MPPSGGCFYWRRVGVLKGRHLCIACNSNCGRFHACILISRMILLNYSRREGDSVQYYALSHKKHHFIVTPVELRWLLQDYHHVIVNTGVHKNYLESDPNDFFLSYEALYSKLKKGEKLIWKDDYRIANLTVGITGHLENCQYEPSNRLSSPNFLEPCPWISTFCFAFWKDQISTAFDVFQFSENVCGLCLYFPSKVVYDNENAKHLKGFAYSTDFDDFETYESLRTKIKMVTKPLKLESNGRIRRTSVRISNSAKEDFANFYFVANNGISVL